MSVGFPVLEQLDHLRYTLYITSHEDKPLVTTVPAWLGHKALTAVCLPCNIVAMGVGLTGMLATASTLGTLKVAIYAGTAGYVKPSFSIGFLWLGERTALAGIDCGANLGEIVYDAADLLYQGYRLVRWIAEKIHLSDFLARALRAIGECFEFIGRVILYPTFNFIGKRISAGVKKANEAEVDFIWTGEPPALIKPLNDITQKNRVDWDSPERPLGTIMKHYVFSVPNIPLNAVIAACSGIASVILSSAYVAKVTLYAATNINIPLPTFAAHAYHATVSTAYHALTDIGTDVGDVFILIYKAACTLRLNRIMATALDVLLYIPRAVFS